MIFFQKQREKQKLVEIIIDYRYNYKLRHWLWSISQNCEVHLETVFSIRSVQRVIRRTIEATQSDEKLRRDGAIVQLWDIQWTVTMWTQKLKMRAVAKQGLMKSLQVGEDLACSDW
jgi:uncharacterized protein YjaG (DUF416 family)